MLIPQLEKDLRRLEYAGRGSKGVATRDRHAASLSDALLTGQARY